MKMKRYPRPRRFSIRKNSEEESGGKRFHFRKYRRKEPIKTQYIMWLFIVFAVVLFLVRWLRNIG